MEFMVLGSDGKEYGPSSFDTLKQWATEGRILPGTQVRNFATGQLMHASQLDGLFGPVAPVAPAAPPPMSGYVRTMDRPIYEEKESTSELWRVIIHAILGLLMFFALHGIGLIFAGYGMYYAIQLKQNESRYGNIELVIAGVALCTVGLGWILRMSGAAR